MGKQASEDDSEDVSSERQSSGKRAREGVETIPQGSRPKGRSASHPRSAKADTGDDIVHSSRNRGLKCNELVVGSNPTRGARTRFSSNLKEV